MMALKKKNKKKTAAPRDADPPAVAEDAKVVVDSKHFAQKFTEVFGRPPTDKEFEEWCAAWGGAAEKDKCVFERVKI